MPLQAAESGVAFEGGSTDAAWLSSARVVRCWVKSRNERNPYGQLHVSGRTAALNRRKAGMTSSPHGSYAWGDTHATMAGDNAQPTPQAERIAKAGLSADWGLQLAPMKAELLVTAYQP